MTLKKLNKKLIQLAADKAQKENNDYVALIISGMNIKNMSDGDRALLAEYLGLTGQMIEV